MKNFPLESLKNQNISFYVIDRIKFKDIRSGLCKFFLYECQNPNKSKKLQPTRVLFIKPSGIMNSQGQIIKSIRNAIDITIPIEKVKIICDDLETEIGKVKFSKIGGNRGHNGLKSIQQNFSSNDFEKIKIGIGRPNSKDPNEVADYVLEKFPECINFILKFYILLAQLEKIREMVYPKIMKSINLL